MVQLMASSGQGPAGPGPRTLIQGLADATVMGSLLSATLAEFHGPGNFYTAWILEPKSSNTQPWHLARAHLLHPYLEEGIPWGARASC